MNQCKICQSSVRSLVDEKKSLTYYRCLECGFIYLDDDLIVSQEREKKQYDQHHNGFENQGYVTMFETFIERAIVPYLKDIKTALDFGSGPGPVLYKLLENRGVETEIYDLYFSPKKVYEGKSYDLITSTEVFEHLQNPLEIFSLLVEHLNPNGYMVLMTKFPPKDDQEFLDWWYRRDPTHISFFTPKSFEVVAEEVGVTVVKTLDENIVVFQKC